MNDSAPDRRRQAEKLADPATVALLLRRNAALTRRNKDLSTKVAQLEESRAGWRARALDHANEIRQLRRRLSRCRARVDAARERSRDLAAEVAAHRRLPPEPPAPAGPAELEQHRLIVRRILAIPPRTSR